MAAVRRPFSTSAPSRAVLQFLQLQSEIAFFSPTCTFEIDGRRIGSCILRQKKRVWNGTAPRTPGPVGREVASIESSFFPVGTCKRTRMRGKSSQESDRRKVFSSFTSLRKWTRPDGSNAEQATSWQERLWGSSFKKGVTPLKPDDLPSGMECDDGTFLSNRRILSAKTSIDPRLRCTEVDEHGNVILVDGEFKKTELIAKYGLLPRDLRKIDSSNLPHILIRPSAILLNLLHLKVLIRHDRVLLFDVYGSKTSYPQSAFMYDLQGKLQQKNAHGITGLPYEFRALEAVLTSVTSELEADFEAVREPVMRILSELEDDIDRHKLRMLLILSKRVSTFEQKVKLVRDAIEELLEADDDLAAMYLTEKAHDLKRGLDDHTEVEMLLESYHKLTDEIVQEAGNLVSGIRNTEEISRAILDANRNALMLLDLKFSVGTVGLAMGTFIAGLYGMNLENFIEETNWGFGGVTATSIILSAFVCWYGLVKLRKVQRVKMMSDERPQLPRGQFYQDEGALGLLDSRNRELLRRAHMQRQLASKKKWHLFR